MRTNDKISRIRVTQSIDNGGLNMTDTVLSISLIPCMQAGFLDS